MNDLDLAIELADLADAISLPHFTDQDFTVETKPDLTPVTECDRAVEKAIMDRLAQQRPNDSVLGEEFGAQTTASSVRSSAPMATHRDAGSSTPSTARRTSCAECPSGRRSSPSTTVSSP